MPRLDRPRKERLIPVTGTPPSLINVPSGCAFHPRCPYGSRNGDRSWTKVPVMTESTPGHLVACHLPSAERQRIFAEEVKPRL